MSGPPSRWDRVVAAVVRRLLLLGWRVGPALPAGVAPVVAGVGSRLAVLRLSRRLDTLRVNLQVATGRPVERALLRAAVASYLRMFLEVFLLPGWPRERVVGRVHADGEAPLRAAMAAGGAVVALPHSGNWDLAGAWACLTGMPVTTVAEELGQREFAAFSRFRRALGMEVIGHRDPQTLPLLVDAVGRGRVVCLIADRDLAGSGLPVGWPVPGRGEPVPVTFPAGPALVARRSGVPLFPAVCRYERDGMRIVIGPPIAPEAGREGLVAMTQRVATFFADQIRASPQDWHMLQPFFPSALPAAPATATG